MNTTKLLRDAAGFNCSLGVSLSSRDRSDGSWRDNFPAAPTSRTSHAEQLHRSQPAAGGAGPVLRTMRYRLVGSQVRQPFTRDAATPAPALRCCTPNAPELSRGAECELLNQTAWRRRRLQLLVRQSVDGAGPREPAEPARSRSAPRSLVVLLREFREAHWRLSRRWSRGSRDQEARGEAATSRA
jgi:hypothetical protein